MTRRTPALDRSVFLVNTRDTLGQMQIRETYLEDAGTLTSAVQTILEIEDNARRVRVHSVVEMNPAEGWCRDVSDKVCIVLLGRYESDDQLPNIVRNFVDDIMGAGYSFLHYRA